MIQLDVGDSSWDINVSLNEEEVAAVRRVLERDSRLRHAEQHRVQRLREMSRDDRWLWGVSGQWFQEIKKANQQRIAAKEKNEAHTKTTGIPIRTHLASLLSFRLPKKKNHGKLSLDQVALRSPSEAEIHTQLAVPGEVKIADATRGDVVPEEAISGDLMLGETTSVETISGKDSVRKIISGEITAVEFVRKEVVQREPSLGETIPGQGTAVEFIHREVTYRQTSPDEIILTEVSPHQVSHCETTARESIAEELAHSELKHKENSLGEHSTEEIIPGKTTTGESIYREASSMKITQKYLRGEAPAGEIIYRKANYGEAITKEVAPRDVIPEKSSLTEIISGETIPGKATAREIVRGESTTEKIHYEVVPHRKVSFGELKHGDGIPREATSREVTTGEITPEKVLTGEFIPGELTFKETITKEVTLREAIPGKAFCGNIILVETVPGKISRKESTVIDSLREPVELSKESAFSSSLKESTVSHSLRESVDLLKETAVTDCMRVPIELSRESAFPGLSRQSTVFDSVRQSTLSDPLTPSRCIGSFMELTLSHSLKEFAFRDSLIQSENSPQQSSGPFPWTEQTPKPLKKFKSDSNTELWPLGHNNVKLVRAISLPSICLRSDGQPQAGLTSFSLLPSPSPAKSSPAGIPRSSDPKNSPNRPSETIRPHFTSNTSNISIETGGQHIFTNSPKSSSVDAIIPCLFKNFPRQTETHRLCLPSDAFSFSQIQSPGQHPSENCLSSRVVEANIEDQISNNLPYCSKLYKPLGNLSVWNHCTYDVSAESPSQLGERPISIEVDIDNNQRSISSRQYTVGLATEKSKRYPGKGTGKLEGNKIQESDYTDIAPNLHRESHWHSTPDFRPERGRSVTVNSVHCSRPTRHERMATGPQLPAIYDLTQDSGHTGSLVSQYRVLSGTQSWAVGCSDRRKQTSRSVPARPGFNPLAFKEADSDSTTDDEYYLSPDQGEKETCL